MTEVIAVEEVPGFTPALRAVRSAGGLLLSDEAAWQLTIIALATAGPHIRAEVLADIADDLMSMAPRGRMDEGPDPLVLIAIELDNASFQIRKALHGHHGSDRPILD